MVKQNVGMCNVPNADFLRLKFLYAKIDKCVVVWDVCSNPEIAVAQNKSSKASFRISAVKVANINFWNLELLSKLGDLSTTFSNRGSVDSVLVGDGEGRYPTRK